MDFFCVSALEARRRSYVLLPCLGLILMLSGCAARSIPVAAPPARPLGRDVPVYQPSLTDGGVPVVPALENPEGTISLGEAVRLALLQNPELAAFAWEIRSREARVLQAGKPPNPAIGVFVEDLGGSRLDGEPASQSAIQPQTTIQLSQIVELGGKRAARLQLAALNRDLAAWDYETARINVLTDVTKAFIDVLAAQETVALTDRTTTLVEQVQQSVGARVAAGVVSPIEETKANIALAAVRVESDRARYVLAAARGRLAAAWGSSEARFGSAIGDLRLLPLVPSFEELKTQLAENPELARWAVEISQRQAALAVEQSKRVPDVSVSAGYRRFTAINTDAFLVGGSISLPIFDRNRGGIEEAHNRLAKAQEERRAAETRVYITLTEAYRALSSAHAEVTALRTALMPGAQQTFEAISEGYRAGKFGYLDVLDAQRTLISAGGQFLRALSDYHKAGTDVERLIGAPLNKTSNTP